MLNKLVYFLFIINLILTTSLSSRASSIYDYDNYEFIEVETGERLTCDLTSLSNLDTLFISPGIFPIIKAKNTEVTIKFADFSESISLELEKKFDSKRLLVDSRRLYLVGSKIEKLGERLFFVKGSGLNIEVSEYTEVFFD